MSGCHSARQPGPMIPTSGQHVDLPHNGQSSNIMGFFTNIPHYKNANIAKFVLAVILKMNWANEVSCLEM